MNIGNARKNLFLLPMLIAALAWMLAGRMTAQTFTTIYGFNGGSDGANPLAGLVLWSNRLYGTAEAGGNPGAGTVFAVNPDGTGFTTLHGFNGDDGANPSASLMLSGSLLYGTAAYGGSSGKGTVFVVNTDGTGFTSLYSFTATAAFANSFTNSDGANPLGSLVLSGNTLYGTAEAGGSSGNGTLFAVNTDGTGFTTLHSFTTTLPPNYTNDDGANPHAGLVLSGNTLYGTTGEGGASGNGTVFAVNTNGAGFTTLHGFSGNDGANPSASLILSNNTLYGTALNGGSWGNGTVFKVNTDGTGFTTLYSFSTLNHYANGDGANPSAGLILAGSTLYGTAVQGGSGSYGTVFSVNTDGTGFTTLHSTSGSDGDNPNCGLVLAGNTLFGTASGGGSFGSGTVFSLLLPPQLTINLSRPNIILTWPTNAAGFALQSTTNLGAPVWATNSPSPVVVNGQNTVTNPIAGIPQFFRLSQ